MSTPRSFLSSLSTVRHSSIIPSEIPIGFVSFAFTFVSAVNVFLRNDSSAAKLLLLQTPDSSSLPVSFVEIASRAEMGITIEDHDNMLSVGLYRFQDCAFAFGKRPIC